MNQVQKWSALLWPLRNNIQADEFWRKTIALIVLAMNWTPWNSLRVKGYNFYMKITTNSNNCFRQNLQITTALFQVIPRVFSSNIVY